MKNGIIYALGYLSCVLITFTVLAFIAINMLVGCETWEDPACVTPMEMFE